jgi:hypothetical protein
MCEEAACRSCFIAFRTPEELAAHMHEVHNIHMPVDRSSRTRVLVLGPEDFPLRGAARGARHQRQLPVLLCVSSCMPASKLLRKTFSLSILFSPVGMHT